MTEETMKKQMLVAIVCTAFSLSAVARGGGHSSTPSSATGTKTAHAYVHGYTKKDGTYVAPHDRSTLDSTKNNNWSTKGNTNPETGKPGTKKGDEE